MDILFFLPFLLCIPFLLASMMRKAAKDKFPILECCILSGGIFMCYVLFMVLPNV